MRAVTKGWSPRWSPRRAMGVLVLCNVLWAGSYVAGKEAMRALSPVELNFLRFVIAGAVLAPLLWQQRRHMRLRRHDLPRLAGLCLLGFVLNKGAEYGGLNLTTAADTALLIASEGIFTAVLSWLLLRERVRGSAVGGLVLGALGIYLVVERGFGLGLPHAGSGTRLAGDLLVVLALVCEAGYTVLGKAALSRYPGLLITTAGIIGSLTVWAPAAAVDVLRDGLPRLDGAAWVGLLYLALASTVVAYVGWMVALRYVQGASAAPTLFLQPLVGTLLAVLLLGERPAWATLAGGLCIVAGVGLASRTTAGIAETVGAARVVEAGAEAVAP